MYKNTLRNRTCQTTAWPSPPKSNIARAAGRQTGVVTGTAMFDTCLYPSRLMRIRHDMLAA